jgi:hypothetical protein
MKAKLSISAILLLAVYCSRAQSIAPAVINSGGGWALAGGYVIEYNFGEMMAIQTAITPNLVVTQGLLQPFSLNQIGLPVTLIRFQGVKRNQYNELSWTTSYESGNSQFELQRSDDARNFTAVYSTPALGLTNGSTYSFNDYIPFTEKVFYRLRIIEAGVQDKYSSVIVLYEQANNYWTLYPNPIYRGGTLQMNFQNAEAATNASIVMLDAAGRKVLERKEVIVSGFQTISLAIQVIPGFYTLIVTGFGNNASQKIIVQ